MPFVFGYIDPGSGSLMIQALIAGLVAIPIFFRAKIARGIRAVRRMAGGQTDAGAGHDEATPGT